MNELSNRPKVLENQTKKPPVGRFINLGSGSWTRTNDIRINSPFLLRLIILDNYLFFLIFRGLQAMIRLTTIDENW